MKKNIDKRQKLQVLFKNETQMLRIFTLKKVFGSDTLIRKFTNQLNF